MENFKYMKFNYKIWAFLFFSLIIAGPSYAQEFGRNKPHYEDFNFKVKETEHFDLYHYMKNEEAVKELARQTEQWYAIHQATLKDTFTKKNPIIFYNNHADFQQTNTISGSIGVGTGGVTEAFKNRVILPVTFSNYQTNHVIGHELVHAFQYDMILQGDSTNLQSLSNLPLWMVEGLAEYLSKGRVDPFTAMWMRDALMNDRFPSLKDMNKPDYFPYRYGQAFWAFVDGTFGSEVIPELFMYTAAYGLDSACDSVLNLSFKNLNSIWENSMENHFAPYIGDKEENFLGKKIIDEKNGGRLNVSPSLSPNGKYVIFLSEKDVFSTDLYLAEAADGDIIRKIASTRKDAHLDALNSMESSGTWSSNSKEFAFVGFSRGRNIIVIKEVETGKTLSNIRVPGIPGITNLAWSPDNKEIYFTGLTQGRSDIYAYHLKNKKVRKITDDHYSELQSSFSADGQYLAFMTDERSIQNKLMSKGKWTFDLAILNLETGEKQILDIFPGADNINPSFDFENNLLFFSDRDGYRNIYKYVLETKKVFQLTDFKTGVSGITEYSPAISVSLNRDRVLYSHFYNNAFSIYQFRQDKISPKEVDKNDVNFDAGTLPVIDVQAQDIIAQRINERGEKLDQVELSSYVEKPYRPKFKLDYLGGGAGMGVGNSTFGTYTGLAGGLDMVFGDILGNHQIYSQVALNGEIYDVGGQVVYLNRTKRIAWGLGISHIPLRTGYQGFPEINDTLIGPRGLPVVEQETNLLRVFDEGIQTFAHYPFSTTLRLEAGLQGSFRSFRQDRYINYYEYDGFNFYQFAQNRERVPTGDEIVFDQYFKLVRGLSGAANVGLVGDNSFFGMTSPLAGHRFRISIGQHIGTDQYTNILADFRKYFWLKPISLAVRGLGYLRYEQNVNSLYPVFIGQMGFVRGYGSFFSSYLDELDKYDLEFGQVIGSKVLMTSGEVRLPFSGPKQLALISSNFLLMDVSLFYDAGVAFNEFSHFSGEGLKPAILTSAGVSARINLFGAIVIEPYYAWPIQKNSKGVLGINLIPGW
jgi:Tol biopolymer transport system component